MANSNEEKVLPLEIEREEQIKIPQVDDNLITKSDSIEKKRLNIEKVTKEDLMKFAKKVHIDTIFILKGDEHE